MGWRTRKFANTGKTPELTIRPTLDAFERSNDYDVVRNMYKTELDPFIKEFSRLRKLAFDANIRWMYNPVPALQVNRFWISRLSEE